MIEDRLPAEFRDLEPFVDEWALATEEERVEKRYAASMDEIRAFYADKKGLYPELFGEVRLKEEM